MADNDEINLYHALTSGMSGGEHAAYMDFLDTQAGLMGLPDADNFTGEQLDTMMNIWWAPKRFVRASCAGTIAGVYVLGGIAIGLVIALLIARRRNIARVAQQIQPPPWW